MSHREQFDLIINANYETMERAEDLYREEEEYLGERKAKRSLRRWHWVSEKIRGMSEEDGKL